MKKTVLLIMALTLPLLITALQAQHIPVQVANEEKASCIIGYCSNEIGPGKGNSFPTRIQTAVKLSESTLKRFKGNKLYKIRVGLGDAPERVENSSIVISNQLGGAALYTQKIDRLTQGWNEITLDVPFEIDGNEFFIGYDITAANYFLSLDNRADTLSLNWISIDQNPWKTAQSMGGGNISIQGVVMGDQLPQYDVYFTQLKIKKNTQPNASFSINGSITNLAVKSITNFIVSYQIEGSDAILIPIKDVNIMNNEDYQFTIQDVKIPEEGEYNISVSLTNLNGNIDEDESNNTLTSHISCRTDITDRKIVIEQFSTMQCSNCPTAHQVIEKAVKGKENIVWITHHSGFSTDVFTIDESESYLFFYQGMKDGRVYAPAMMIDRKNLSSFGASSPYTTDGKTPGPVGEVNPSTAEKLIDLRLDTPAFVTVNIDNTYNPDTRLLNITVSGTITSDTPKILPGKNSCINIYLIENGIAGTQDGHNGEYIHNHVLRKVVSNVWGDRIEFSNKDYSSKQYSITLPTEWDVKNMKVIAFIGNSDNANSNNCEIYNANQVEINMVPNRISETQGTETVNAYFNPDKCTICIEGEHQSLSMYSVSGIKVRSYNQTKQWFDVNELQKGVYFIKIDCKEREIIKKVFIR